MTSNAAPLAPVHPNVGLEISYQRKLEALIDEMNKSLTYWITAAYRQNKPRMAHDASPAMVLRNIMKNLARHWMKRFDKASLELAKYFALNASKRSDSALAAILNKSGFAVKFNMTRAANDVMQATIGQQVGLIKSIAEHHLGDVEGLVMRSVQTGRDLETLNRELKHRFKLTKKRAALIARDQNNKATAAMTRVRQQELGITKAIWVHSAAGKEPRPEHVAANGKEYDVAKGMFLEGVWTWPGVEINCRCVSRPILPGLVRK